MMSLMFAQLRLSASPYALFMPLSASALRVRLLSP